MRGPARYKHGAEALTLTSFLFHFPLFAVALIIVFTGSIARSATRRYLSYSDRDLSYSDRDFEVYRPAGVTHCTDGGEIWHGEGSLLRAKFHSNQCNDKGIGLEMLNSFF